MSDQPPDAAVCDRRASPRSPVIVREARCIAGMEVFFGYATDLSRSGLFIGTPKMRPPGAQIEIRFRLPGVEGEIACLAEVVWTRPFRKDDPLPPGFGLRFLGLSEEAAETIDAWVASSPPA